MECLLCRQSIVRHYTLHAILWTTHFYGDQICQHCLRQFVRIDRNHACAQCGRLGATTALCQDCREAQRADLEPLKNEALLQYNTAMHDYFQAYKRHGDYCLRLLFAGSLRQALQKYQADYLFVYIPTSVQHYQQRQFDPVLGLFGDLCPLTALLGRNEIDWHQSELKRAERLKAPQTFAAQKERLAIVDKNKILLLDDIYTTGTTLRRGATALRTAGFTGEICALTLAR
ncbi:ComF family protein [Lapidilactobacillus bayanensis]|uniref:ComF family protein n=1 Tax=Lapidilactobacillus bayanensis TaxID=2485998 RepID=UPI000F7AACCF|nr:ComF family protein [Lapidilactobacillus bayanensis]